MNQENTILSQSHKISFFIGVLLIAVGLAYGIRPIIRQINEAPLSTTPLTAPPTAPASLSADSVERAPLEPVKPERIMVPSLGIDVAVLDGYYNPSDASWTLSEQSAHFAMSSKLLNDQNGNTFIYGHNNAAVFGPLLAANETTEVIVRGGSKEFVYRYYTSRVVAPNDVSSLSYSGPPILTLQTCSGAWYQNRTLLAFALIEVRDV